MRIAAIYDIHGNLPALEAVLRDIDAAEVDALVVGGDVLPGPMPAACLDALFALQRPVHFLRGNGEREVLAIHNGTDTGAVPEAFRPMMRWVGAQLTPAHRHRLAEWPATLRLDVLGLGPVLFCHATPHSDTEIFTHHTPPHRLRTLFADADAPLVICGHTHMQFDLQAPLDTGSVRVVNAGSVGMPFGVPGAYWLLLGPTVTLRRTDYDLHAAAHRVRATDYPQAEAFAEKNIVQPPSEAAMIALFEGHTA